MESLLSGMTARPPEHFPFDIKQTSNLLGTKGAEPLSFIGSVLYLDGYALYMSEDIGDVPITCGGFLLQGHVPFDNSFVDAT